MPPVGFEPTLSAGEQPQAAHLLRSWVRIPPGAWIFVCCECRVLSGRGLCDELTTRPEESYQLCCVVVCDLETSRMGAPYIYDISHLRVNKYIKFGQFSSRHFWVASGHPSSRQDSSVKKYKSRAYEAVTLTHLCKINSYLHLVVSFYFQSICIPLTRTVSRNTVGEPAHS